MVRAGRAGRAGQVGQVGQTVTTSSACGESGRGMLFNMVHSQILKFENLGLVYINNLYSSKDLYVKWEICMESS